MESEQEEQIDRESILLSLATRTFKKSVLIFCGTKIATHRLKIIFGLAGLKAAELHGNLTQLQVPSFAIAHALLFNFSSTF